MSSARVRNVVLVGPAGAGKSTLSAALVARCAAEQRPADGATPARGAEHAEGPAPAPTLRLAASTCAWEGVTLNLLDTPGHPDFVAGVRAGLHAADGALFVLSGTAGIDPTTAALWEDCAAVGLPRSVVVTQLDHPDADFDERVAMAQRVFGHGVTPVHLPMHADDEAVAGSISLVTQRIHDFSGGQRVVRDADPQHLPLIDNLRADLIELVLAESEHPSLLADYLDGREPDGPVLAQELHAAASQGFVHPVLAVASRSGVGLDDLLDQIVAGLPPPDQRRCPPVSRADGSPVAPLGCDPAGPLAAQVIDCAGPSALLRVFSGTVRIGQQVSLPGQRLAAVTGLLDLDQKPRTQAQAGEVCVITGLAAAPADTVSAGDSPLVLQPWEVPAPQLPVALRVPGAVDEAALRAALDAYADPTARLERVAATGQLLLWSMGEAHERVLLDLLGRHVDVDTEPVRVALRATLPDVQRIRVGGGSSQDAAHVEVHPADPGSGLAFSHDESLTPTGGDEIERRVREHLATRPPDAPDLDAHVRVIQVHDSGGHGPLWQEIADGAARALVLAATRTVEPVCEVTVTVPVAFAGTVRSDLGGRRAHAVRSEPVPEREDLTRVCAQVPERALLRYAVELRALTHATGSMQRRPLGYAPAQ